MAESHTSYSKHIQTLFPSIRTRDFKELTVECVKLQKLLENKFLEILNNLRQDQHINEQICDKIKQFQIKALEHEINKALGK